MKLYISYILLIFPMFTFCQKNYKYSYKDGYTFLKKAQKQINKSNIGSAKKYLDKAKDTNYGFCGNAWADAESKIKSIEAQILNAEKKYNESLKILESISGCYYGANCIERDFLKVETLILKFGKDKVKSAFRNVNDFSVNKNNDDQNYSVFFADLDYKFNFMRMYISIIDKEEKVLKRNETGNEFINIIQNQTFYSLLK